MKKKYALVLIYCTIMLFNCGCVNDYTEGIEKNGENSAAVSKEAEYITDAQNYYSECIFADDGIGYYFTVMKADGYQLFYFDGSVGEAIPLCSKVNCTHSDKSCDSYFNDNECMEGFIWYQNNYIFRIEQDIATREVYLISCSRDGSNPQRICVLWNGDNIRYRFKTIYFRSMVMHNGYLYYTYQLDVENNIEYYRVPIKGGERELIGTIENTDDIQRFGEVHFSNSKTAVYLSLDASTNNIEERMFMLYKYDIEKNTYENIYSESGTMDHKYVKDSNGETIDKIGDGWSGKMDVAEIAFDDEDNLYSFQMFSGKVVKHNLKTGESKQIYQADGSGTIAYYDGYLYIDNYDVFGDERKKLVIISLDGEIIQEIPCGTPDMYLGDDKYLFFRYYAWRAKEYKEENTEADYVYIVYNRETGEFKKILQGTIR